MDDGSSSVVAKAAATFSRDKFLRPLRALCVSKITSSLKFYLDKGVTSLHTYLLPKLCQEVFDDYVEQMQYKIWHPSHVKGNDSLLHKQLSNSDLLKIAGLFVNSGLKRFDTIVIMSELKVQSEVEERRLFFKKLAEGAPNLASFEYHRDGFARVDRSILASDYLSLGQMSHLITLNLNRHHHLTNADLQVIGTNLPLLRRLEISLEEDVTIKRGVRHLKKLKMLEYLIVLTFPDYFDDYGPRRRCSEISIIEFCLVKMPKLKIAGYTLTNGDLTLTDEFHDFSTFEKMKEPVELVLQHLLLKYGLPPANVSLPHVTHLQVASVEALEFCLGLTTFPKLKELLVYGVPFEGVLKLLQSYGHNLTTLGLTCIRSPCDLLEMINLCPHLENLSVEFCNMQDLGPINPSVSTKLAKMKKISLDCNGLEAAGLFELLMASCPDLEDLYLEVRIPQSEVDQVAAGIASGAFLCTPKIKEMHIKIWHSQRSMVNLVNQVVAHCPKLSLIHVHNAPRSKFGPLIATVQKFGRSTIICD